MAIDWEISEGLFELFAGVAGNTAAATGTADSGTQATLTDAALTGDDNAWQFAIVRFTSGANAGKSRVVSAYSAAEHKLAWHEQLPAVVADGDGYTLSFGELATAAVYEGDPDAHGDGGFIAVGVMQKGKMAPCGSQAMRPAYRDDATLTVEIAIPKTPTNRRAIHEFVGQCKELVVSNQRLPGGLVLSGEISYEIGLGSLRGEGLRMYRMCDLDVPIQAYV